MDRTLSETAGFVRRLPLLHFHVQIRFKSGVTPVLKRGMISCFGFAVCHEGCVAQQPDRGQRRRWAVSWLFYAVGR